MKANDLTDAALDWAVATAEGVRLEWDAEWKIFYAANGDDTDYSTNWSQGGPLIEREGIRLIKRLEHWFPEPFWQAAYYTDVTMRYGPTPLIAAMRCYVASKLGDDIDVPKELTC